MTDNALDALIELSRARPMSPVEQEAQRRSFAYGNTVIENAAITRDMIDSAADRLGGDGSANGR